MEKYGIIGYPLSHSFSPAYFRQKFQQQSIDANYSAFELPSLEAFPDLLKSHPDLRGLNVTLPYKEEILPYLNHLTPEAADIGAVNCIDFKNGQSTGYNTDARAFVQSLQPLLQPYHQRALVLGSGGASLAVKWALQQLGIEFIVVSRSRKKEGTIGYDRIDEGLLKDFLIVINTTPVGMFPDVEHYPHLLYEALGKRHLLFDLVYNPSETLFLRKGKAQGAKVCNGAQMLILQAEASWEIWSDRK